MKYPSGKVVTKQDRAEAAERLREWLKDGDTLWFILRHRAASGMSRIYNVKQLEIGQRKDIHDKSYPAVMTSDLSWTIASACDLGWNENHGGIRVNGCGFSGEQEVTEAVSRLLGIKLRYETL